MEELTLPPNHLDMICILFFSALEDKDAAVHVIVGKSSQKVMV